MFPIIGLLGERVLKTKGSFQNLAVNVCEAHTHRCQWKLVWPQWERKKASSNTSRAEGLAEFLGGICRTTFPKTEVRMYSVQHPSMDDISSRKLAKSQSRRGGCWAPTCLPHVDFHHGCSQNGPINVLCESVSWILSSQNLV